MRDALFDYRRGGRDVFCAIHTLRAATIADTPPRRHTAVVMPPNRDDGLRDTYYILPLFNIDDNITTDAAARDNDSMPDAYDHMRRATTTRRDALNHGCCCRSASERTI